MLRKPRACNFRNLTTIVCWNIAQRVMATAGTRLFSITLTVDQNGERLEVLQSVGKCAPSFSQQCPRVTRVWPIQSCAKMTSSL